MKRHGARWLAWISAATFLLSSSPAAVHAAKRWLGSPPPIAVSAACPACPCCQEEAADGFSRLCQHRPTPAETPCPFCPLPSDCCWACFAKLPCCLPVLPGYSPPEVCIGGVAEASLLLPPSPCRELIQPPRG